MGAKRYVDSLRTEQTPHCSHRLAQLGHAHEDTRVNAEEYAGMRPAPGYPACPDGRVSVADPVSTSQAVFEIRRLSGLDWDELAAVFGVSRSDVCSWANGSVLSDRERFVVLRTLAAIRHVYRGTSDDTRSFLLEDDDTTGMSVLELLRSERLDEVMAMPGRAVVQGPRPALSEDAQMLRRPAPPILLLDADHSRPVIATNPRVAELMRAPRSSATEADGPR